MQEWHPLIYRAYVRDVNVLYLLMNKENSVQVSDTTMLPEDEMLAPKNQIKKICANLCNLWR